MKKLLTTMCLIMLSLSVVQGEPNEPNLIKPGDGIGLGYVIRDSIETSSMAKLLYQYGVSQFFGLIDIEKQSYKEVGVKWESRDLAKEGSVPVLSWITLLFAPEESEITGTAGVSHSWDNDDKYFNSIGGVNIRPKEDENFLIEIEGVTPLDGRTHVRVGFVWKF